MSKSGICLIAFLVLFSGCASNRMNFNASIPSALPSDDNNFHPVRNNSQFRNETETSGVKGNPLTDFINVINGLFGITTKATTDATPEATTEAATPPENCDECKCGIINTNNRIVNGQETQVNQYPWMASLYYSGIFYCGASLINDRYVLTAAHCVEGINMDKVRVHLLEHELSDDEDAKILRKVQRAVTNSDYNLMTKYNNDLSLLQLDEVVQFNDVLRPVCLPIGKKLFTGLDGIVTGWGVTSEMGEFSNVLLEATLPIISNEECRRSFSASMITDSMLCAGYKDGGKDSCQGDSGGPLHVMNDTIYQIVGVVSWGDGCGQANKPGVYARVNKFLSWISANTKDACYC